MPFGYEETRLWTRSLAARDRDAYSSQRQKLTSAYHNFRERAALVAAEIPQDLREYTVHDVTHLDALWERFGHGLGSLAGGPRAVASRGDVARPPRELHLGRPRSTSYQ